MKIKLTESEKRTLKFALDIRYDQADISIKKIKAYIKNCFSLGDILFLQYYSDVKSDIESIYRKILNEDIRKEIRK